MRLGDRIAFACRYLADDQLDAYIEEQVKVRFTGRWREETAGRGGSAGKCCPSHLSCAVDHCPVAGGGPPRPAGWTPFDRADPGGPRPLGLLC